MKRYCTLLTIGMLASGVVFTAACAKKESLAVVNGESLDKSRFEAYLEIKRISPKDDAHKQRVLDQYLEREALARVIELQDVLNAEEIAAELNEFKKEMLISRYFEKRLAEKVTDQAVLNFYNSHASEYQTHKIQVAHILFRTNKSMSETERKAKLTAAQNAMSKIHAGEAFDEVAKTTSEDRVSGGKGGDLGWLAEGAIDPRFSKKIFSLSSGDITEPFESGFGYHIVKYLDGPQVVTQPFEKVKGRIRHQLRNEVKQAEIEALMSEIDIQKNTDVGS